jgi:hypothetical protein
MYLAPIASMAVRLFVPTYKRWEKNAVELQRKVFRGLVEKGKSTIFGHEHNFSKINSHDDFTKLVPIKDYEGFRHYIDEIVKGQRNVLWPGWPLYFAKTSGTTSGVKYIPITADSMPNHIKSARHSLSMYIYKTGKASFVDGKYIFLSGSPELETVGGVQCGRLSGIVNHHVPGYVKRNQLPLYTTNCINDWEQKLDAIVGETISQKMTLISGIPPWVEMYFKRLMEVSKKSCVLEIFPNFSLYVHGGVNFKPYQNQMNRLIGTDIDMLETFPASEGFFAFQDEFPSQGLLLIPDSGIFFEFVPVESFSSTNPPRLTLADVELNKNYVLIVSTNAGLWAYNTGDTVKFTSLKPYRVVVTGRLKHFTSAFGEHVIAEEVDHAMSLACERFGAKVTEFTVAPRVVNSDGLPCHDWYVEFAEPPANLIAFSSYLDELMQSQNAYYKDLIKGNILQPLVVRELAKGAFVNYMKQQGKLGGQNKVPRLTNDRGIVNELDMFLL